MHTEQRNYIQTAYGNKVYLPRCEPESIDIRDIARGLSMACRFAGQLDNFYSVAEHSINASYLVGDDPEIQLQALMHDATEAYLCDVPTPFKVLLTNYKELEDDIWLAVCARFGINPVMYPEVKRADATMLMSERDALRSVTDNWGELEKIERVPVKRYGIADSGRFNPTSAEAAFLHRFTDLISRRGR